MRTTITLADDVLVEAKRAAAASGRTLSAIVEDALRAALARPDAAAQQKPFRVVTVGGRGLLAGVDLDDSAALTDLMDGT